MNKSTKPTGHNFLVFRIWCVKINTHHNQKTAADTVKEECG